MPVEARKELSNRPDLLIIADLIKDGASVLDLGCGNGSLLHLLRAEKGIYPCGVEISQEKILECVRKGVPVVHGDLNEGLSDYGDKSFDHVVLSQTIQAVKRPDLLLEDMMRVGREVLISILNIGCFAARSQLFFGGRMPVTGSLPSPWYDTPNIHLATIKDFRGLCRLKGAEIIREIPFGASSSGLASFAPNLFAPTCVFVIRGA
jgi:methionine biosynthesis protein MetW